MRILFLDDDPSRHRRIQPRLIGHVVDYVFDVQEATQHLAKSEYDLVFLDHDLNGNLYVHSDGPEPTGYTVVMWIIDNQPKLGDVICHSLNDDGRALMVKTLRDGGYTAHDMPFLYIDEEFIQELLSR